MFILIIIIIIMSSLEGNIWNDEFKLLCYAEISIIPFRKLICSSLYFISTCVRELEDLSALTRINYAEMENYKKEEGEIEKVVFVSCQLRFHIYSMQTMILWFITWFRLDKKTMWKDGGVTNTSEKYKKRNRLYLPLNLFL